MVEVVVVGFVAAVAVVAGTAVVEMVDYVVGREFAAEAETAQPCWVVVDCTGLGGCFVEKAALGLVGSQLGGKHLVKLTIHCSCCLEQR